MSTPPGFDRLSHVYRWMEYFSFGPYLQKCRDLRIAETFLPSRFGVRGRRRPISCSAVATHPAIRGVAVDASCEMLFRVARTLPPTAQVRLVHADALECQPAEFPDAPFDLVVSHFFLDCFNEAEISSRYWNA